jgi:hypothetical protein
VLRGAEEEEEGGEAGGLRLMKRLTRAQQLCHACKYALSVCVVCGPGGVWWRGASFVSLRSLWRQTDQYTPLPPPPYITNKGRPPPALQALPRLPPLLLRIRPPLSIYWELLRRGQLPVVPGLRHQCPVSTGDLLVCVLGANQSL